MYYLISIADVYYIVDSYVPDTDVLFCKGTQDECELVLAMYEMGYIVPVPVS